MSIIVKFKKWPTRNRLLCLTRAEGKQELVGLVTLSCCCSIIFIINLLLG